MSPIHCILAAAYTTLYVLISLNNAIICGSIGCNTIQVQSSPHLSWTHMCLQQHTARLKRVAVTTTLQSHTNPACICWACNQCWCMTEAELQWPTDTRHAQESANSESAIVTTSCRLTVLRRSHVDGSVIDPAEGHLPLRRLLLAHQGPVCQPPDARRQFAHILLSFLCL